MSDIRLIQLESDRSPVVSALAVNRYFLGEDRIGELENLIPKIVECDYWSPDFQAWEPFLTSYLMSGANPPLASAWLKKLGEKIELFEPEENQYSAIYSEVVSSRRSKKVELFVDYSWPQLVEFSERCATYINNEKTIMKFLYDADRYNKLLSTLLEVKYEDGRSKYLAHAIYLYRHCMLNKHPATTAIKQELEKQINYYVERFVNVFDSVASFPDDNKDAYQWYTDPVKNILCRAWKAGMELHGDSKLLTAKDLFNMPVWLSEQITSYVSTMPPVVTTQCSYSFVFNAIEYILKPNGQYDDPNMIYAFCIPRSNVNAMLNVMNDFYWDVREHRIVQLIIDCFMCGKSNAPQDILDLKYDLSRRGFPVEV